MPTASFPPRPLSQVPHPGLHCAPLNKPEVTTECSCGPGTEALPVGGPDLPSVLARGPLWPSRCCVCTALWPLGQPGPNPAHRGGQWAFSASDQMADGEATHPPRLWESGLGRGGQERPPPGPACRTHEADRVRATVLASCTSGLSHSVGEDRGREGVPGQGGRALGTGAARGVWAGTEQGRDLAHLLWVCE